MEGYVLDGVLFWESFFFLQICDFWILGNQTSVPDLKRMVLLGRKAERKLSK